MFRSIVAKCFRLGVSLFLLFGVVACGENLDFVTDTLIFPDGAVTRETSLRGLNKDQLESQRYVLPAGGKWEAAYRYKVEKRYPPGSVITSDYVRKARFSNRVARNEPRLTVRDYFFFTIFDYEELFRDIVTPESFDKALQRLYSAVIHNFARYLTRDGLPDVQTERVLRVTFNPLLEKLLSVAHSRNPAVAFEALDKDPEFKDALETEQVVTRVIQVLPPMLGHDSNSWRKAVAAAYSKALESAAKNEPTWEEDLLGVHGFHLFQDYTFSLMMTLPGKIVETNAKRYGDNVVVWVFKSDAFEYRPIVLRARSTLFRTERIGMAGIALAAAVLGLWYYRRRRRQR